MSYKHCHHVLALTRSCLESLHHPPALLTTPSLLQILNPKGLEGPQSQLKMRGQDKLPSLEASTFPPRNSSITSLLVFHLGEGKAAASLCFEGLVWGRGWLQRGRETGRNLEFSRVGSEADL